MLTRGPFCVVGRAEDLDAGLFVSLPATTPVGPRAKTISIKNAKIERNRKTDIADAELSPRQPGEQFSDRIERQRTTLSEQPSGSAFVQLLRQPRTLSLKSALLVRAVPPSRKPWQFCQRGGESLGA